MKMILKAEVQQDLGVLTGPPPLCEAWVSLPCAPVKDDTIEVRLADGGRAHLVAGSRNFTPEGEVEVWVRWEGYDLADLEAAMQAARAQYRTEVIA